MYIPALSNHLWGRKYYNATGQWGQFVELTAGNPGDYDFTEQIYPSLSKTMDSQLHIVYQFDLDPGAYVEPYVSPGTIAGSSNTMMYLTVDKSDLILNKKETNLLSPTINVYPNPVADYMDVDFTFTKSSDVKMNIYNAIGNLVKSESFVAGRGESKRINTKDLAKGIYLTKFETAKGTFTKKIIKQ